MQTDRSWLVFVFLAVWTGCAVQPSESARSPEAAGGRLSAGESEVVLVSNEDSGDISVVDPARGLLVKTIPVGKRPRGIKAGPDGRRVYVALSGSPRCPPWMSDAECDSQVTDKSRDGIAELDLREGRVVRILPGGSDPEQFDVSRDGTRLYVSNEDAGQASIVDVGSGRILHTVEVGTEPEGVRLAPDGRIFYVTGESDHDVTVVNAVTGEVVDRIAVGARPRDVVFSSDGSRAYVSSEIDGRVSVVDVEAGAVVSTIDLPPGSRSMGLALSRDDRTLYVANGRAATVCAVLLDSSRPPRCVRVGERPWGIALSLDGRRLYTANGPSNDLAVIDLESLSVKARIPVGSNPWGVIVVPGPWPASEKMGR